MLMWVNLAVSNLINVSVEVQVQFVHCECVEISE